MFEHLPTLHPASPNPPLASRREMIRRAACGFGHVALLGLLHESSRADAAAQVAANPFAPRLPHFVSRAKRVIFIFLHGGVSHIDSFDPKPKLTKWDGRPLPFDRPLQFAGTGNLMKSPWQFRNYGQSGLPVSDLWPHLGTVVDEICFIRSMHVEQVDHGGAVLQLHTGSAVFPRPSVGSWVVYGLGSENQDLPGFVVISPPLFHGSNQNYGSAFLPAAYQGTAVGDTNIPMTEAKFANLRRAERTELLQRMQLDLVQRQNRRHLAHASDDSRLDARIEAFELAFRMQGAAPEVMDLSTETRQTFQRYGVGEEPTDNFGRQCLLARRLAERGVKFIQCTHSYKWDQHSDLFKMHKQNATEVDKPIAGLITDLKQRGMLDETLVVWGTEFGRTPVVQPAEKADVGRDHNPYGFTLWMAGGGVRGGMAYGATDEFGYFATENPCSMYDFHATILHLLGIDHTRLTYRYNGRDFRLTDVHGEILHDIIA